jgi:hypothetical protein
MSEDEKNKLFNAYLEMAISQGWADPVSYALRRVAERVREESKAGL